MFSSVFTKEPEDIAVLFEIENKTKNKVAIVNIKARITKLNSTGGN